MIKTTMKKYPTAVVAVGLGMSEVEIAKRFENAKELNFAQVIELASNDKIKRYDDEAKSLINTLNGFNQLMN